MSQRIKKKETKQRTAADDGGSGGGLLGQIFRNASRKAISVVPATEELWSALNEGDRSKVHQILKESPSLVNNVFVSGRSPLHFAAETKNTSLALLLLEHGANINEADERGWFPLHFAAYTKNEKLLMMLLMQRNIDGMCYCLILMH